MSARLKVIMMRWMRRSSELSLFCRRHGAFQGVDRIPAQVDDGYERLFKIWKKISKRVLGGADGFHRFRALAGYDAYAQLLPAVSILLRPQISLNLLEM